MTIHPEDLVECWHLIVAGGGDPIEWMMDQAMWDAVEAARNARECIDAGDPLPIEGALTLLGTPVDITDTSVPLLRYRSGEDGKVYGTPILGNATERSSAPSHSIRTNPPRLNKIEGPGEQ